MRRFLPCLPLLVLAACAGPITTAPQGSRIEIQQETQRAQLASYKTMIEDEDRVFSVAFPLLAANAPLCGERVLPSFGFTVWNLPVVKDEYRAAATRAYNLHNRLAVQHVADRSPAARAGVRSGDFVVAINGEDIPRGYSARKQAYQLLADAGDNPVEMTLERDGRTFARTLRPVRVCAYPVEVNHASNAVNAFADGNRIVVERGLLRFVRGDNELAMVLGHEMGHNVMDHMGKKQQNALVGGLGGLIIDSVLAGAGVNTGNEFSNLGAGLGGETYSVEFEQEADYVGMYFMERAGYSSRGVADLWRRMAAETPRDVGVRTTHPTSPERFVALEHTHQEILAKKARRQPLIPDIRAE